MEPGIDPSEEFETLFHAYQQPITSYLVNLIGDLARAEELAQETFLRLYRSLEGGNRLEHPRAWLYRIASRIALDHFRRARLLKWLPLWSADDNTRLHTADFAEALADRMSVQSALASLKVEYRMPLLLHLSEGLSTLEIAEVLGISQSAVKMRLFRARQQFQSAYNTAATQNEEVSYGDRL
jgi:RNA polymerase sigma-70 factor (ECF subfamily)